MNNEEWYTMHYDVMRDKRLTLSAVLVYAIMYTKKSDDTNEVQITSAEIAKLTGQSESTVKRAVKRLKETGYITDVKIEEGRKAFYTLDKKEFWD